MGYERTVPVPEGSGSDTDEGELAVDLADVQAHGGDALREVSGLEVLKSTTEGAGVASNGIKLNLSEF